MSDRYCTYGTRHKNLSISARDLMSCCTGWNGGCGDGCNGGQPALAMAYWVSTGIKSTACQPYPYPSCAHHVTPPPGMKPCPGQMFPTVPCASGCTGNSSDNTRYFGSNSWSLQGEEDFMQELVQNGPFAVAFDVYSDFPTWTGPAPYQRTSGSQYLGGHAVKVVGVVPANTNQGDGSLRFGNSSTSSTVELR
jgi:hypothetical protein